MKLMDLGYDSWFQGWLADPQESGHQVARVSAVDRGGGLIINEAGEVTFALSGRLRFSARTSSELPCVGDWVLAQYHNAGALAIIHWVFPRRTFLRRKYAGRNVDCQMIASNIDTAFIVQSCHYDFNLRRFDRYLLMANEGQIEPTIVLTKTDLVTQDELDRKVAAIKQSGISTQILALSNATGAGLDEFRRHLTPGRTCCLLGSSGVGKTTIINRLVGRDAFDTKTVSCTGEGVHATSRRQLVMLDSGALLIDTPGMRELGVVASSDSLEDSYSDIQELASSCQYSDCSHIHEPGCSVREAIESGIVSEDRYKNYLKLKKESRHRELSCVEKHRKDKAFGKFVKSVKKQLRR